MGLATSNDTLTYQARETEGIQSPGETLRSRSATRRDFAWLSVFLAGAGCLYCDPTNRIEAGFHWVPVVIARHPGQAVALEGAWFGEAQDDLGRSIHVAIRKVG